MSARKSLKPRGNFGTAILELAVRLVENGMGRDF
jgi:hypothetical protein